MPSPRSLEEESISRLLAAFDDELHAEETRKLGQWRLREAAAVLSHFSDPYLVKPAPGDGEIDDAARMAFADDIETVRLANGEIAWRLTDASRRLTLDRIKSSFASDAVVRLNAALDVNLDRPKDATQDVLEMAIRKSLPSVRSLNAEQLFALDTVTGWFGGMLETLPPAAEVRRAIARERLLVPLRALAGKSFVGREVDLARLTAYVGVGQGPSIGSAVVDFFSKPKPMVLYGPGGMGKSTLIARFILQNTEGRGSDALPFALLDIDSPNVDPRRPATLLLEMLDQVTPQLERLEGYAADLRKQLLHEIDSRSKQVSFSDLLDRQFMPSSPRVDWIQLVAGPMNYALDKKPMLLVLDTFEEAQFLGPEVAQIALDFLRELQRAIPTIKIVISGRSAVEPSNSVAGYELLELKPEAAARLLRNSLPQDRQDRLSEEDLLAVTQEVGGNPMVLSLCARLLAEETPEQIRDVVRDAASLKKLKKEAIQARLFRRVLGHVHGDDVKKLAIPGLLLRRITPDVIREVLAEPCRIDLTTERTPEILFEELGREVALVTKDGDALRHRADLRRVMLEGMKEIVLEGTAREIEDRAIRYWSRQEGAVARGEEIYHRLRRGDPAEELNKRWIDEAAPYLRNALEEIAPSVRPWLANKLAISLDRRGRDEAGDTDWQEQAARIAGRYLENGQPQNALKVVYERGKTPPSRLSPLEIRALLQTNDLAGAERAAQAAVQRSRSAGEEKATVELLLLQALVVERRRDFLRADTIAAEALAATAQRPDLGIERLQLLLLRQRLRRLADSPLTDVKAEAVALVRQIGSSAILADPGILREVGAELGDAFPDLLEAALARNAQEIFRSLSKAAIGKLVTLLDLTDQARVSRRLANVGKLTVDAASLAIRALLSGKAAGESSAILMEALRRIRQQPASATPTIIPHSRNEWSSAGSLVELAQRVHTRLPIEDVQAVLQYSLGRSLGEITSPANSAITAIFDLVHSASREGWIGELVDALKAFSPGSQFGVSDKTPAEAITRSETTTSDPPSPGEVIHDDDLQKGRWGGMAKLDGRELVPVLRKVNKDAFIFEAVVRSTDGSRLEGPIVFWLHDSYPKMDVRIVKIRYGTWAIFEVIEAHGVFVIGAQVRNAAGQWIGLEADLADLSELPGRFLEN